jgi:low affinity Fe/Cu permease
MKMPSDRWLLSIITGVAVLAMQGAFLIALHLILH